MHAEALASAVQLRCGAEAAAGRWGGWGPRGLCLCVCRTEPPEAEGNRKLFELEGKAGAKTHAQQTPGVKDPPWGPAASHQLTAPSHQLATPSHQLAIALAGS